MNIYLIVFEILDEDKSQRLIDLIKQQGPWARITRTAWCVKTEENKAGEIRTLLRTSVTINSDERLFVVNITNSAWASYYLPTTVADWLKE